MSGKRTKATLVAGLLIAGASSIIALFVASRRKLSPLTHKVLMITGGSRGLGLAIAETCLEAGGRVALIARELEELQRARGKLLEQGFSPTSVLVFACDVTDESRVQQTMKSVVESMGEVDVLINNAGIISVGPLENQTSESFHQSMDTNFFGALNCTLAILPRMLSRGAGQIVNIASIGGLIAVPHLLPYSASKFALVGFSRGLAIELKPKGIHVLTVCPWLMRTGSHLQALFSGQQSKEYRWFSLGATFPVISMSARDAAKRITAAIEKRRSELMVSAWSFLTSRIAQNAPVTTSLALSEGMRLALPAVSPSTTESTKGFAVRQLEWQPVDRIGSKLALEWNQKDE